MNHGDLSRRAKRTAAQRWREGELCALHLRLLPVPVGDMHPDRPAGPVETIQRAVCDYYGLELADLKSHRRHRAVSFPRMVAMYLCRQRLGTSFPELGDRFGGKDHTTVMSAVRKIDGLLRSEDPAVMNAVEAIERRLDVP